MQTHETDPLLAERPHTSPLRREEGAEAMASRAIEAGRPGVMHPGAVLHLQRAAGNASVASFLGEDQEQDRSPVKDVVGSGGGTPLDKDTRQFMESRLGHDFGDVRVHTDSKAAESAKAVNAQAYTVGTDIVFQSGKFAPGTHEGRHMLAHELTHVVQQRSGPVSGTPAPGGINISDPSDSFEQQAERTATHVMTAETPATSPSSAASGVQRQEEEAPEEEVQGSFIQRQEEEEPEEEVQGSFIQRQEEEEMEEEAPSPS
jgi:hypothetical protein